MKTPVALAETKNINQTRGTHQSDAQHNPKWHPKSPKIAKIAPKVRKKLKMVSILGGPGTDLLPRSLLKRPWAPFWLILDGLLMDLGVIFDGFPINGLPHH